MDTLKKTARRGVAELSVIVLGVLLALWADAALAERRDRGRETALLEDLRDEFALNEGRLLVDIEQSELSRTAAVLWGEVMRGEIEVGADSLAALWYGSLNWARFDPLTGALRSVIDGGELGLIQNDELRQALAGWSDAAEEARLTAGEMVDVLAGQSPIALQIEPGRPMTVGERAAARFVIEYGGGSLHQLRPLLARVREIQTKIEAEISR